jgi:hypothetical protein
VHFLSGTEGSLTLPRFSIGYVVTRAGRTADLRSGRTHWSDPYAEQMRHFCAVIEVARSRCARPGTAGIVESDVGRRGGASGNAEVWQPERQRLLTGGVDPLGTSHPSLKDSPRCTWSRPRSRLRGCARSYVARQGSSNACGSPATQADPDHWSGTARPRSQTWRVDLLEKGWRVGWLSPNRETTSSRACRLPRAALGECGVSRVLETFERDRSDDPARCSSSRRQPVAPGRSSVWCSTTCGAVRPRCGCCSNC